jgi:hypothetical protein
MPRSASQAAAQQAEVRQRVEVLAHRFARQGVHAHPVALLAVGEDRRVALQAGQPLRRFRVLRQGFAQGRMQRVDHRGQRQEGEVGRRQVAEQVGHELFAHGARLRMRPRDAAVVGRAEQRQRQLQAERPTLGDFMQPGRGVGLRGFAGALPHQLDGFGEAEAQLRGVDQHRLAIGHHVVQPEIAVGARRHDAAQVGRRVAQHIGQRLAGGCGQAVGFVHYQHHLQRALRQLGQPGRHAFEAAARRAFQQHVAEGRAAGAAAHREREGLHEARHLVLRLRLQPGHRVALGQVLQPPLGQQRGLAETGRRLHQDHRTVAQPRMPRCQLGPGNQVARHTRRRDLQEQVAGGGRSSG